MTRVSWQLPATGAALSAVAVVLAALVTAPLQGAQWDSTVAAAAVGWAFVLVARARRRLPPEERRPWSLVLLALGFGAVQLLSTNLPGQDVLSPLNGWLFLPTATGSLATCWALSRVGRRRRRRVPMRRLGVEGLYVCAAVFTAAFALVAEPVLGDERLARAELWVLLAYCAYPAVVVGYAAVVTTLVQPRLLPAATALLVSQSLSGIAACAYALTDLRDARLWLTVSNVAMVVAVFVAVLACRFAGRRTAPVGGGDATPVSSSLITLRVVRTTLLAPPVALAAPLLRGTPVSTTLTVLCCVLFVLIAAGISVFLQQITALTQRLRRTQEHFRDLVESSSDVITVLDDELRVVFASPAAGTVLGVDPAALAGTALPDLVDPADRARLTSTLTDGGSAEHVHLHQADVGTRELEVVAEGRRDAGLIVRLRDVTDRREHERTLERMAFTDVLTGLPNRAAFSAAAAEWLAEGVTGDAHLAVVDLDGFKAVNDRAGHEAGDQLLVEVARRLRRSVRESDVVARLGGDEFALLLRGSAEEADETGRRLITALSLPQSTPSGTFAVGASVGISALAASEQISFREADSALRSAKQLGKGCLRRWTSRTDQQSARTLALVADLPAALAAGRLRTTYLPATAPGTGRVVSLELLPSWPHPGLGVVGAEELRAVAALAGRAEELSHWLLRQALVEAGPLVRGGAVGRLAVTVPPEHRPSPDGPGRLVAALEGAGLRPDQLAFLVTEETLLTSARGLLPALREAHEAGVRLCMSDYGLGRTLLAHRSLLPFDLVSVDVRTLGPDDAVLGSAVRATVAVADALGMATLVAGVSRPEQYAVASDLGVAGVTGSFVSDPVPAAALPALLGLPDAVVLAPATP